MEPFSSASRAVSRVEHIDILACRRCPPSSFAARNEAAVCTSRDPVVVIRSLDILDGEEDVAYRFVVVGAKAVRSVKVDLRLCPRKVNPDPFAAFLRGLCHRSAIVSAPAPPSRLCPHRPPVEGRSVEGCSLRYPRKPVGDVLDLGEDVAHRFVRVRAKAVRSVKVDLPSVRERSTLTPSLANS